jgi:hypothetical protein
MAAELTSSIAMLPAEYEDVDYYRTTEHPVLEVRSVTSCCCLTALGVSMHC